MSKARINKSLNQKLYFLEDKLINDYEKDYTIIGSTGNIYTVKIKESPTCSCPDYTSRKNRCKHIYFVLIKLNNLSEIESNKEIFEKKEILKITNCNINENLKSNLVIKYNDLMNKTKNVIEKDYDDSCFICLDDLMNGEDILTCKKSCGKHVHKKCFEIIKKENCLYCGKNIKNETNYLNIFNE